MSNYTLESVTVETPDGVNLRTRVFKPKEEIKDNNLVIVLVHPYSVLGGCQGLLKGIASGLAEKGYKAITFDMRGVGRSTGRASLTGFAEVKDVISVCSWVSENLNSDKILLVGSSAGAPIAGSAVDQIEQVVGYVSLGYPFGMLASVLFGRHHKAILQSEKPKLFVMGTRDGFTSVKQLKNKLNSAAGRNETHLIEGVSHFQMEGPAYDSQMEIRPMISMMSGQSENMGPTELGSNQMMNKIRIRREMRELSKQYEHKFLHGHGYCLLTSI